MALAHLIGGLVLAWAGHAHWFAAHVDVRDRDGSVWLGGRLPHGATLLRELRMPSAVIPQVDDAWRGREVQYRNGELQLAEAERDA